MNYPILNISEASWAGRDPSDFILFDNFVFTKDESFYENYLVGKIFCDCNGELFEFEKRILPKERWRYLLGFLPGVFKVELIFGPTMRKRIKLDELKNYLVNRIGELENSEFNIKWIEFIKNGKSFDELIAGSLSD